ncbi:hypothetical protein CCS01_19005 [Rhodopila globiformis]|uniref:Phenol degradation protein meta n=2 Tax=Rhodopila globiformis TaxID=1071 RepID=A0A2S6N7F3_RHOGL|nr:hypothetical protein CCS01_19005 [Rhodopila globiformis]
MKRVLGATALALAGVMSVAGPASAMELWDPHLRGVDEGLAAGALPPPGVYGVFNNYWASFNAYDNNGKKVPGTGLQAFVAVPIALWSTGIKVLGADFGMAIAQPFDYTSAQPGYGTGVGSGNWGLFNTVLVPGILSWTLGDFHVSTSLSMYLPTATSTLSGLVVHGHNVNGGLPSGNGYFAVQPDFGVSWLHDGWNLSASLHLTVPVTASNDTGYSYKSGNQFSGDYTATKTLGKWTFGLGVHQQNQVSPDSSNGPNVIAPKGNAVNFGLGPIVGYTFGNGVELQGIWNHDVIVRNDVGGDFFNVRLVTAF